MPPPSSKYARIERERRFLLERFPHPAEVSRVRYLTDRYILGTSVRLRRQCEDGAAAVFKLTQKTPSPSGETLWGLITTIYLTEAEYAVFAALPAQALTKTRHSIPPFGIDVFEGTLEGLFLAEAEFDCDAAADALLLPPFISAEVTHDPRFTGGRLARATRSEVGAWLQEFGIQLGDPHCTP